jgi:hypothetical protein
MTDPRPDQFALLARRGVISAGQEAAGRRFAAAADLEEMVGDTLAPAAVKAMGGADSPFAIAVRHVAGGGTLETLARQTGWDKCGCNPRICADNLCFGLTVLEGFFARRPEA